MKLGLKNARVGAAVSVAIFFICAYAAVILAGNGKIHDKPYVVVAVAPPFPQIAVASNIDGSVVVEVKVNPAGEVTSTQIKSGHPLLRQVRVFEETARQWRFTPTSPEVGEREAQITFVCKIMKKETAAENLTTIFKPLSYQVEIRHRPYDPVVDSDPVSYTKQPKLQRPEKP
jgi:TonB family protein